MRVGKAKSQAMHVEQQRPVNNYGSRSAILPRPPSSLAIDFAPSMAEVNVR